MKIKFLSMVIILATTILIFFLAATYYFIDENRPSEAKFVPVCFGENCFNAELAISLPKLARGLMLRKELAAGAGMLFVFSTEAKHSFWMKNTLISLDMIWINKDKEIVYIAKNVQPCGAGRCVSISPNRVGKYVLEINGGKSDEIGLKIGDKASFELR